MFDDGNELPNNLIAPRSMGRGWVGWTPITVTSDETQSFRTKLIEETPPPVLFFPWLQPLNRNVWWQFQSYPLAAAGVEDAWFQTPLVCTPVILVNGWIFSPGLQSGTVFSPGMQQGQTAKAGQ
jgi:hypothetical protein